MSYDNYGSSFGGGRGPREMFDVTCSSCGQPAQVPFQPSGDKPVYCSSASKNAAATQIDPAGVVTAPARAIECLPDQIARERRSDMSKRGGNSTKSAPKPPMVNKGPKKK